MFNQLISIFRKLRFTQWLVAIVMIAASWWLGFRVTQTEFGSILAAYIPFFAAYAWVIRQGEEAPWRFYLGLAIVLRVLLLFSFPQLSDDVYRFIWDGRLLVQGHNPFDHLPGYYLDPAHAVPGLTAELYAQLNSPEYFTIYPPIAQASFAVACWLFPVSIVGSAGVMKLFLLVCELGSLWLIVKLLRTWELPVHRSLIYALNPLIIVEISGNLHYEGAMIFFLLLGIYWLTRRRVFGAAAAVGLSIASKLLPLLFLPFFFRRLRWAGVWRFFPMLGIVLLLLFLPLLSGVFLQNFGESLDLYFRKFEFNASIYYIARWVGFQQKGYNLIADIGPALAFCTFLGISLAALLDRRSDWRSLPSRALFAVCLYLLFTTTVHPWYLSLPIVLCLFTRWRFPLVWSALIVLTYSNYAGGVYEERLWVVGVEYVVVGTYLLWEMYLD